MAEAEPVMKTDENSSTEQSAFVSSSSEQDGTMKNIGNNIAANENASKEAISVEEKERDTSEEANDTGPCRETVKFRVVWNKKNYEVTFALDETVDSLKQHIESLTGLPVAMQKLMYKGLIKDGSKTLRHLNVVPGAKMMVVGSTIKDVLGVTPPPPGAMKESKTASGSPKELFSRLKMHKKVLDKGKPDDAMPAIKDKKENLPSVPMISGMYNKYGGKVRLTFKLEVDQLWISTKERTEKLPMGSVKNVVSEPIEGHDNYHMMGIQLGPTEASRYWLYWVPAQYVDAIKDTILGKWQPF